MKLPSQVNNPKIPKDDGITQNSSKCIAYFFPIEKNEFVSDDAQLSYDVKTLRTGEGSFIEDDAIISCSIAIDKNSPTGSFEMQLKSTANYCELVTPGDWVAIYLDTADKIDTTTYSGLKVIGSVTRVARNKVTMGDGSIVTTYSISGGNWGKILSMTDIYYDPYIPKVADQLALKAAAFNIRGGPLDYVNSYLNIFLGDAKLENFDKVLFQLLIPSKLYEYLPKKNDSFKRAKGGDVCFDDILVRDFDENANEGYALNRPLTRVIAGSVWNVISQAFNQEINEMYLNTKNGSPTWTIKKKPLTKQLRLQRMAETIDLDSHNLYMRNIVNANLGTSDHALFNYVTLFPSDQMGANWVVAAKGEYVNDIPQINRESIKKFGIRRVELATEYAYSRQNSSLAADLLIKWIRELGEYWLNFYRFENGTIEVIGKTDFYIGDYYLIPEYNKAFLVESIQWDWRYQSPITVSLGVTHGVKANGDYIDQSKGEFDWFENGTTNVGNDSTLRSTKYIGGK